jgi:hypothetical protein
MPLATICPGCQQQLKVPDHLAGKRVRCPKCKQEMLVPLPAATPLPPPADDSREEFPERPIRSNRRRSGSRRPARAGSNKTLYWVLGFAGGGFVLTVLLCGAGLWVAFNSPTNNPKPPSAAQVQVRQGRGNFNPPAKNQPIPPVGQQNIPPREQAASRITVKEQGFSIVPPNGWARAFDLNGPEILAYVASGEDLTATKLQPFENEPNIPNFSVEVTPHDGTPIEAMSGQLKSGMPLQLQNWRMLDEGFITIDGKKSYRLAMSFFAQANGQAGQVCVVQYIVVHSNKLYVITYAAGPKRFSNLRGKFEQSALSAQFN